MYKTMIIDDDAAVRERLKDIIDWQGLSLELVCEAGDSDTALEMYLLYRPKIIISDISIPRISGLELAEAMRKEDADMETLAIPRQLGRILARCWRGDCHTPLNCPFTAYCLQP